MYTLHDILKRLLILIRRVRRRLRTLNILPVVPLHFKCRYRDTRVKAVNVFVGIRGKTFKLADEGEEFVDVITVRRMSNLKIGKCKGTRIILFGGDGVDGGDLRLHRT